MANSKSYQVDIFNIICIILFIVFCYISAQTPSSKDNFEWDYGYDIHVDGHN